MKKLLFLLLTLLITGGGNLWADETETFDYSTTITTKETTQNGITITLSAGGHSTSDSGCWSISDTSSSITISTTQSIIKNVAITYTSSSNDRTGGGDSGTTITTGGGTFSLSGTVGTWSNATAQSTVKLTYSNKARIKLVVVTTTAAAKNTLSSFELNANDVVKYDNEDYNSATKIQVNALTFAYDETNPYLRLKLNLGEKNGAMGSTASKDYFTIESSSDETVIQTEGYDVGVAGSNDDRVYIFGVKVLKPGTSTLTFKFNGTPTYEAKTCEATITVTKAVPSIVISANVESIVADRGQAQCGHTYTLTPTLTSAGTDVTEHFDVTYQIVNVDDYANSASVTSSSLYAGKTVGKFNVLATATPKAGYTESYDAASTTIGFDAIAFGDTGSSDDVFNVSDFGYNGYINSSGVNQTDNKLDRTLKGFTYTFTNATDNSQEGVKYNNNNVLTLLSQGHMGINEGNQGNCTIYRIKLTYTAPNDVTLTTNLTTDGNETIYLPAGSNKTLELTNIGRSWFAMTNTSSNSLIISAIEILYTNASLSQGKITPTLSFSPTSATVAVGGDLTEPTLTTDPKTLTVTYSSSNTTVATVDNYGVVTAKAAGTATITATSISNDYFTENSSSYALTVTEAGATTYTKWDFTTLDIENTIDEQWTKPDGKKYYENQFTTETSGTYAEYAAGSSSQLYELKFGRSGDKVKVGSFRLFEDHMGFNSNNTMIKVPVSAGQLVKVTMGVGTLQFKGATLYGNDAATQYAVTVDNTEVTLNVASGATAVDLTFVGKPSLYKIQVVADPHKALTDFRPMGGQTYSHAKTAENTKIDNYIIYFQPANAITSDDLSGITVTSSDNTILDVSSITKSINTEKSWIVLSNLILGEGGSATLNVAFAGNVNYKPASTVTPSFIVMAPGQFRVQMSDLTIQAGNRGTLEPIITDKQGNPVKITETSVSRLDSDDDAVDYSQFFDFTYSIAENTYGVSIPSATDPSVVTTANVTSEGNGILATVTATPKEAYKSLFTNTSETTTATIKVEKKQQAAQIDFYLDAAKTKQPILDSDFILEGSTSVFENVKNGRMFYMTPKNAGDEIWFTYSVGSEAADVYRPSDGKVVKKNGTYLYQYRNGFPVHIDDATTGVVYANFLAFTPVMDSSGKITYVDNGSPVKAKFIITEDGPRPVDVTYAPATTKSSPYTVMNTSLSVTANGTVSTGNKVYAKFSSTGTNYTTEQLINEANVIIGTEKTGVFSTEVAERKISGVQIYHDTTDGFDYVSKQTNDTYYYEYATTLAFNTATEYASINQSEKIQHIVTSAKYYDKSDKVYIEKLDEGTVTYAFEGVAPTGTTIDTNTGEVTIGNTAGTVVVVATYKNRDHKYEVNSRKAEMATTTAKYTIIISDPSAYLPIITPSSQNFSTTLNAYVKANGTTGYDAYYVVVTDGSSPTKQDIVEHGQKVSAGETSDAIIIKDQTTTVYAVTYNESASNYYSEIVQETYTKVDPIPAPTFNPDGTVDGGYSYVTPTLKVEAFTQTEGASVYYTLDGTEPVIGASNTFVYDGLSGILLGDDATTTIKAIAVKDGITSEVVTATYQHTDIAKPIINVNGAAQTDNATVSITPTTPISITNPTEVPSGYTAKIYYTLDGSDPSVDNGIIYTGEFTSPKAATLKAITAFVDSEGNVLTSDISTVTLTMTDSNRNLWEAIEETTPGGKLDKDKRTITSVDDITATFGGADNTDFTDYTIDDSSLGTPLDGVGTYSIRSSNDALDETDVMYTHTSSLDSYCATTHEKTFKIPAQGSFVRFEPTKDGKLTIWALQQGAIHFDQDATFCDRFIRRRPAYLVDEQGKSIQASEVESSARLSSKWTTILQNVANDKATAFVGLNGKQNGVTNNLYDIDESMAIYNMYINYFTKNNIGIDEPIKPFAIHTGENSISEQGGHLPDNSTDMTGYVMASGGYVKYTFPVKAGKSYYFFGHRTKLGIRGFQFIPTETDEDVNNRTSLTINADGTDVEDIVTGNIGKTVKVTLNRNFTADTWATLVLPFSVSETALQEAFGTNDKRVDIIHFDDITGIDNNTISLKRHWYKMIVAGTPVLIYPRKAVNSVVFDGVQIEATNIDEITGDCDDYTMKATYSYLASGLATNDYYMNTSGNFRRFSGTSAAVKATRAWLRPKDPSSAKELIISTTDAFVIDESSNDDYTTRIIGIENALNGTEASNANGNVYNLQGQLVSSGSLSGLPRGVYIVNGKKVVVE